MSARVKIYDDGGDQLDATIDFDDFMVPGGNPISQTSILYRGRGAGRAGDYARGLALVIARLDAIPGANLRQGAILVDHELANAYSSDPLHFPPLYCGDRRGSWCVKGATPARLAAAIIRHGFQWGDHRIPRRGACTRPLRIEPAWTRRYQPTTLLRYLAASPGGES